MQYRRDVDGLRAVAVIAVILYHAKFSILSGGYIGVDIFFVISGYLITSIIVAEMQSGDFSLRNFYERRARRILPALYLVMAFSLPLGWVLLLPMDMKLLAESQWTMALFSSNFLFLSESGYFDVGSDLKPLLHTWSLAVEEQYYILFPLFLILVWRHGKDKFIAIVATIAGLSLAAAQWGIAHYPMASFYLLPTRAWELMVGALVALFLARHPGYIASYRTNQILSLIGVGLISYSIFFFSDGTPVPGLYALIPTAGVALILLYSKPDTFVGTLLGLKGMVAIGLISYSAYLWHQPIFALVRHASLKEPGRGVFAALVCGAFVLAFLSWRYVEKPFRSGKWIKGPGILVSALAGTIFFVSTGLLGQMTDGYYWRDGLRDRLDHLQDRIRINQGLSSVCDRTFPPSEACGPIDNPEAVLWGDSYAMHLMAGLQAANPKLGILQLTLSGCGPVLGIAPVTRELNTSWAKTCLENNDRVFDYLKQNPTIKYVVMSSPFAQYVDTDAQILLRTGEVVSGQNRALEYFLNTLQSLNNLGIQPILFSPTPQNGVDYGRCLVKAVMLGLDLKGCNFRLSDVFEKYPKVIEFLKRIEKEYKVVWLSDAICQEGICSAAMEDTFIYRDTGHLSYEGSTLLGRKSQDFILRRFVP